MLMLCIGISTFAQFKVLATGNGFEEPENGYAKVIQEKNGYTFYLHITYKEGINLRIYDKSHQQVAEKNIMPDYGKLRVGKGKGAMGGVQGIYEINKNIVLFLSEYDDGIPTLYRMVINGITGELLEEKTIGTLNKFRFLDGYAAVFGKVPTPAFYVRKDAESDNYAVALFNSFASDRNERIEIVHYNKDNQEISRAYYQSPDNDYKYLSFMDLCVRGDKEIVAIVVGMNTRSSGGDLNGTLLMGALAAGEKSFDLQRLTYPDAAKIEESMIRYNKAKDEYILISVKPGKDHKDKDSKAYRTVIKSVGGVATTTMINSGPINRIANKHYDKKDQFLAIPQILYLNDDGSYTIVFEENKANAGTRGSMVYSSTATTTVNSTTGRISQSPGFTHSSLGGSEPTYYLQDIGIIEYNADGTEKGVYYIPKSQKVQEIPRAIYYSFRDETGVKLDKGNQFKSFYFFNGKNKRYVLMNDIEENQERIDKGKKVVTIQGLGDCDAYSFELLSGENMPKRKLVFEDKEHKKEKDMALFAMSDFDRENNVLVTLKLEHVKNNKQVKLVWLQPE